MAQGCSDVQVIVTKTWLTLTCSRRFTSYFLENPVISNNTLFM